MKRVEKKGIKIMNEQKELHEELNNNCTLNDIQEYIKK